MLKHHGRCLIKRGEYVMGFRLRTANVPCVELGLSSSDQF